VHHKCALRIQFRQGTPPPAKTLLGRAPRSPGERAPAGLVQRPAKIWKMVLKPRRGARTDSSHGRVVVVASRKMSPFRAGTRQQAPAQVDGHAQRFQHVCRSAPRSDGRLPCLATLAPAAAATRAPCRDVEVAGPPPPCPPHPPVPRVPRDDSGTGVARARIVSTKPASSGACSPRVPARPAARGFPASGASPLRIWSRTRPPVRGKGCAVFGQQLRSSFNEAMTYMIASGTLKARCVLHT